MIMTEGKTTVQLRGSSSGGAGPDLTGYPHLTYAPLQWGEGVRCQSNGTAIGAVAYAASYRPIEEVAASYEVRLHEVIDALRYARATGTV